MIIEAVLCVIGVGLTVPAVIAEASNFGVDKYKTWVQFLPQLLLCIALGLRLHKKGYRASLTFGSISILGSYFLLVFNTQNSAYVVCSEFSMICPESADISCSGALLQVWEAVMYLVGLCFKIIGTTLLVRNTSILVKNAKAVAPEDNNEDS